MNEVLKDVEPSYKRLKEESNESEYEDRSLKMKSKFGKKDSILR